MIFRQNKRGADKVISVYWFVVLFIVAGAIVYMVSIFYGKPYDARGIEADLLTDKIADCVSYAGYMKDNFREINNDNFLEFCGLNFEVEDYRDWKEQGQYYFELSIKDFATGIEAIPRVSEGNSNLKDFCLEKSSTGSSPICLQRKFYSIDDASGTAYQIEILGIVRKTEKND